MASKTTRTTQGFAVTFPAMRGVQAGREYYVIMCPLRYLPRLFLFDEEDVPAQLRAQRSLNRNRLPALVRYVVENRKDYVFSALTASIDGSMDFETSSREPGPADRLGLLHLSMDSRFLINDGQHRRAAIEEAMKQDPSLADETIPIVIFYDEGLHRSQQMFADLNRHAVRPAKSIGVLYDHRDDDSGVARLVVLNSDFYRGIVEMEKSSLAARSRKLFTLSALYNATQSLLNGQQFDSVQDAAACAQAFWEAVAHQFPVWDAVRRGQVNAGDVRSDFIHSHGIALHALGRAGSKFIQEHPDRDTWPSRLEGLRSIDWARSNTKLWEGRALIGGRVSKANMQVTLTANVIRRALGQVLSPEEQRIELAHTEGRS